MRRTQPTWGMNTMRLSRHRQNCFFVWTAIFCCSNTCGVCALRPNISISGSMRRASSPSCESRCHRSPSIDITLFRITGRPGVTPMKRRWMPRRTSTMSCRGIQTVLLLRPALQTSSNRLTGNCLHPLSNAVCWQVPIVLWCFLYN